MPNIDIMTSEDVPFAIEMTDHEKWGNIPSDFARLIAHEPEGCFVAREGRTRTGMITTTSNLDYAFMGGLIVRPEFRDRGIGKALMMKGLAYLRARGVKFIELDGTFEGVPLYRKLGFRDKYLSLRMCRPATARPVEKPPSHDHSVEDILTFDRRHFGFDRSRLLRKLLADFSESIHVHGIAEIDGYAMTFQRRGNLRAIGPIVALSRDVAESLLVDIIVGNEDHDLAIGFPETVDGFSGTLQAHGFEYRLPSLRMYLGEKREYESFVYAIVSPGKG
jgi:ribosomal protein S18 acetylase RimI-like enzyme